MAVESATDRAAFVNPDEFGVTAVYTTAAGADSDLDGVFAEPFATAFGVGGAGIATSEPRFTCRSADLPAAAAVGDRLAVSDRSFRVATIEPDGTGMTALQLEEP